jgi:putative PIN family toxin of toxin-antitoxin system
MRLILDTIVLVAGVRSRTGASNPLVIAGFQGRFRWCCSVPLFYEYEDVLNHAEFLLDAGITRKDIGRLLESIARTVEPAEVHFRWRPQLADPADEMVLEAAINAQASVVTHNRKDFAGVPARFDVEVLTPVDALRRTKT